MDKSSSHKGGGHVEAAVGEDEKQHLLNVVAHGTEQGCESSCCLQEHSLWK